MNKERGDKKVKKKLSIFLAIMMFLLSILTGCTQSKQSAKVEEDETKDSSHVIEITDMAGRNIVLDRPVERVVAIGSALRLYTYVNGTEKLVGVERKQQSKETGRPYIIANPELEKITIIGEGFPANPDPELLIDVNADVIIAGDILDIAQIEELQKKIGVPIVIVNCGSSAVFDQDMYKALTIIGKIVGKEERSKELIEYMEDCKTELTNLTKDIPEDKKPSVYMGGLSYKGVHGIESTTGNSPVLDIIGAKNVADEIGKSGSIMIDKEQLIEWDPDILIIDENGMNIVNEDYNKNPDYYNELSAVKNDKVYGQLPYVSYYNNIETAMADIYFLGKTLYPNEFKDIDVIEKADEIYTFMLGKPLYNIMAEKYGGYIKINLKEGL